MPTGDTLGEYRESLKEKLLQARDFGFKAAKLEICINGPYTHNALQEHDDHIAGIVAECRDAVGADMTLMVDVAYAWDDARTALRVIKQLEPFDLFFLERRSISTIWRATPSFAIIRRFASPPASGRTRIGNSWIWRIGASSMYCSRMWDELAASAKRERWRKLRPITDA